MVKSLKLANLEKTFVAYLVVTYDIFKLCVFLLLQNIGFKNVNWCPLTLKTTVLYTHKKIGGHKIGLDNPEIRFIEGLFETHLHMSLI